MRQSIEDTLHALIQDSSASDNERELAKRALESLTVKDSEFMFVGIDRADSFSLKVANLLGCEVFDVPDRQIYGPKRNVKIADRLIASANANSLFSAFGESYFIGVATKIASILCDSNSDDIMNSNNSGRLKRLRPGKFDSKEVERGYNDMPMVNFLLGE